MPRPSAVAQEGAELRARGWPIATAGREVGVPRTTAANRACGYKVYRGGQVVRTVAPLDPLAVRVISARYLSQDERIVIADLHRHGFAVRAIAAELGRSPSTISRGLRRNLSCDGGYRPLPRLRHARWHRRPDCPPFRGSSRFAVNTAW